MRLNVFVHTRLSRLAGCALSAAFLAAFPADAAAFAGLLQEAVPDPSAPPDLVVFLGRLHPLAVHLPIGFLLLAALLEVLTRSLRFADLRPAVSFTLLMGALSAVGAVIAGLLLEWGGAYEGAAVQLHKRLGIGLAVAAVAVYVLQRWSYRHPNARPGAVYQIALLAMLGLLFTTSHHGGALTHGDDYLTEYMPQPLRAVAGLPPREADARIVLENVDEARLYHDIVYPILDARCLTCHNPNKTKGELRMDTPELLMQGGESGPVIVAGQSDASELFHRVTLPDDDEDRMPPDGRRPLTSDQLALIRWWIDTGASFDARVAEVEVPADIDPILQHLAAPDADRLAQVPPADPAALDALRAAGVHVAPLADGVNLLQAHFTNVPDSLRDEALRLLEPVAPQLAWLHLGRAGLNDKALADLPDMEHLSRLHLEQNDVTDAGLAGLERTPALEYLNLYGTRVTDAGLDRLSGLSELRRLYLWQTEVTEEGAERLRTALPNLEINLGWDPPLAGTDSLSTAPDTLSTAPDPDNTR